MLAQPSHVAPHAQEGQSFVAASVALSREPPVELFYRPLKEADYDALKVMHTRLFPIDYEDGFFTKAVTSQDRVFSWAAVRERHGSEEIVGFVTARVVYLYECDPTDRQCMGLGMKYLDGQPMVYVLTLGVAEGFRHCGIARCLLGLVQQHACQTRCRGIFLHVVAYNTPAINLYAREGYQAVARLPNFYQLATGRQPDPDQTWYDAFLYISHLDGGPEPPAAMQWAGNVLGMAAAPFRSVMGTINHCMPQLVAPYTRPLYSRHHRPPEPTRAATPPVHGNNTHSVQYGGQEDLQEGVGESSPSASYPAPGGAPQQEVEVAGSGLNFSAPHPQSPPRNHATLQLRHPHGGSHAQQHRQQPQYQHQQQQYQHHYQQSQQQPLAQQPHSGYQGSPRYPQQQEQHSSAFSAFGAYQSAPSSAQTSAQPSLLQSLLRFGAGGGGPNNRSHPHNR